LTTFDKTLLSSIISEEVGTILDAVPPPALHALLYCSQAPQ